MQLTDIIFVLIFWNLNHVYIPQSLTHTRLTALYPEYPGQPVPESKTNLDFTEARDSEWHSISWAICKSAPHSRQTTMPAPHHSVFYRPDALPAAQLTVPKHWTHIPKVFPKPNFNSDLITKNIMKNLVLSSLLWNCWLAAGMASGM